MAVLSALLMLAVYTVFGVFRLSAAIAERRGPARGQLDGRAALASRADA